MKAYMLTNGLPVLYYLDTIALLKIRNVSKPMRKRATHIFRTSLTIFDPCSSLFHMDPYLEDKRDNKQTKEKAKIILKGQYLLKNDNQARAEQILSQFCDLTEMSVYQALSVFWGQKYKQYVENSTDPMSFEDSQLRLFEKLLKIDRDHLYKTLRDADFAYDIEIFNDDIDLDNKISRFLDVVTIGTAKNIYFPRFEISKILPKLNRIKYVDSVIMDSYFHDLSKVHWFKSIQRLILKKVSIETEIELPNLRYLRVYSNTKGFSKINCSKLETFDASDIDESLSEIRVFKRLKVFEYKGTNFNGLIQYLPTDLRAIIVDDRHSTTPVKAKAVLKQCPNLVKFTTYCSSKLLNIDDLIGSKIKEASLSNKFDSVEEYPIRFNQIVIDEHNYSLIHSHPEIISKASRITVMNNEFDWKYLPDDLRFFNCFIGIKMDQERAQKYLYKFKNCKIKSIEVERSEYARKLLQVTNRVKLIKFTGKDGEKSQMFNGTKRKTYFHWEWTDCNFKFIGEKSCEETKWDCSIF